MRGSVSGRKGMLGGTGRSKGREVNFGYNLQEKFQKNEKLHYLEIILINKPEKIFLGEYYFRKVQIKNLIVNKNYITIKK